MENQTRFDLNAAVENWRNELAAQPNLASDDRRELETHLRDAIAGFQQRGLNDEESFWLARRRVGQPPQLGEEFVKADSTLIWRERVFWMLSCVFLLDTLGSFSALIAILIPNSILFGRVITGRWYLIPLIAVVVLIGLGKMPQQISKLAWLINGRKRLATMALLLILASSAIHYYGRVLISAKYAKMGLPPDHFPVWQPVIENSFYPFILAVLIVWLMPTQNRKTQKRA